MKFHATCAILLLAVTSARAQAQVNTDPLFREFAADAYRREAEGKYKDIHWQKDMKSALAQAAAEVKPLLVVLVVGERGKKNAAEC